MKKKNFYSHIVSFESLSIALNSLDLSKEEKFHLLNLADSTVHHAIVDLILSELDEHSKHEFLTHLSESNHDKLWKLLNATVSDIESKIQKTADKIIDELNRDIKETKA